MKKKLISKEKKHFFRTPSTFISIRYAIIALIFTLLLMIIIPKILNYGPGTINTPFDVQMSGISYTAQFAILSGSIVLLIILSTKFALKDIDKWYNDTLLEKNVPDKFRKKIRKKCFNLPYTFYLAEVLIPFFIAILVLSITGSHSVIMISKIIILIESFCILLAVLSFIFSKDLYDDILSKSYKEGDNIGFRISLKKRIFILIFPICLVGILITALVGYSVTLQEKENLYYQIYTNSLNTSFDTTKLYSNEEILNNLEKITLLNETDTIFIMNENYEISIIRGNSVSNFIVEYMKQVVDSNNGRIYDSYGVDTQGSALKLNTPNGSCYVCILFSASSTIFYKYLIVDFSILILILCIITNIFGSSLSNSLHQIYLRFKNISSNSAKNTLLPVISNDEIGDLVLAFNEIQKINNLQIEDIQNKQDMLVERERLASLGQMVGGIAHNLKTPIFSISGGVEGLSDLIKEFDESIDDPTVNSKDMHDIAKDMKEWTKKIKGHLSYMSEIITAVKGQAVNLSGEDSVNFTVQELISQTSILMKHELNKALINFEVKNNIPDSVELYGNINSLVQVLNNLISNSIQAYAGKENEKIELLANLKNNKITLTVKDYGPGLPEKVKSKLFKEMITTKGKEGTGLGLFMSYSMIKAKFNGTITFETSEKGTSFNIIFPYSSK